ncbi:hypothetical protein L1887_32093 [Cichorium endivia]|nr:hypothetical protein L1887_32093 [Cichorium endivia]
MEELKLQYTLRSWKYAEATLVLESYKSVGTRFHRYSDHRSRDWKLINWALNCNFLMRLTQTKLQPSFAKFHVHLALSKSWFIVFLI